MARIRHCIVNPTHEYKYCPHCGNNQDETWRFIFCSEECREVYHIYDDFRNGIIDAFEAQKKFKNHDLTDVENFSEYVKPVVKEILAAERAPQKAEGKRDSYKK